MRTLKGERTLLSGEKVPEYNEQIVLEAIETQCPDKWAFVDLETGNIYRWSVDRNRWISPPPLARKALQSSLTKMISLRKTVPGVSE